MINVHLLAARVQRVRVVLGDQQQARAVAGLQVEVLAHVRVLPTDAAQTVKARLDARIQRPPVLAVWRGVFAMQRNTRKCARRSQQFMRVGEEIFEIQGMNENKNLNAW